MAREIRVAHVIADLHVGGAEMVLLRLLSRTDRTRFSHHVVSIGGMDDLGPSIRESGWPVTALGLSPTKPSPTALLKLGRALRKFDPDVVQTWMYHADLLGGVMARFATDASLVWGVHQTDLPKADIKFRTRAIARVNRFIASRVPDHVVFCSRASAQQHVDGGYPRERSSVIPNGFEVTPRIEGASVGLRTELDIPLDVPLVGRVGRFHPQKDYGTFVEAARILSADVDCHFVLVGEGLVDGNAALSSWIGGDPVRDRVHLLGLRRDIDRIHGALDVAVSSSAFGEAFPLVIGEAMLQGTPVVATDVGDSALIVGDGGKIVPPEDPVALARALRHVLELPPKDRAALGDRARQRVVDEFSLARMVDSYQALYQDLVGHQVAVRGDHR